MDARLARRLSELRADRALSLEDLSVRSGVSRSTISKIERQTVSPTAAVLNKLAIGLGVMLPALFGFAVAGPPLPLHPVTRRRDQPRWRDPESGYQRRTLTPPAMSQPMQLSEIHFPPGACVTFENAFRPGTVFQQIWMLKGEMSITLGPTHRHLTAGDCMAMVLDQPITFRNPGTSQAHYLVVIAEDATR